MKKILTLIAAAAMLAVSCQKETPVTENAGNSSTTGKLTATIVKASTKVSYSETPELNLQPAWEVGDKIIGFDDAGNTYTLTVASVAAETATLNGTVPDGALHLIYKSGASASDISAKSLAIDYTAQAGDKTMPAVMLADGTVENGSCNFAFTNAGAIIGISAVKGVPSGSTICKIAVEGENLSAATVTLDGSALKLTATEKILDAINTATLSGITVTDDNGTLSSPVFVAVPAGANIVKVSASVPAREPETMKIPSTAADKKDIDYVEIEAKYDGTNLSTKKWAKWNVGANSEKDYGWYFDAGYTEGYFAINRIILSVSGIDTFSYYLESVKTADASDYLFVNTQSFTGHFFDFQNDRFNYGRIYYDETYFSRVRSTVCPDDILALDYDAARVNWGGSWRLPTNAEFKALINATYCGYDTIDNGFYVFAPDAAHPAGKKVSPLPADLSKDSALLFFPMAGGCSEDENYYTTQGQYGYYKSSSFDRHFSGMLFLTAAGGASTIFTNRFNGYSVRPVSD